MLAGGTGPGPTLQSRAVSYTVKFGPDLPRQNWTGLDLTGVAIARPEQDLHHQMTGLDLTSIGTSMQVVDLLRQTITCLDLTSLSTTMPGDLLYQTGSAMPDRGTGPDMKGHILTGDRLERPPSTKICTSVYLVFSGILVREVPSLQQLMSI